MTPPLRAHFVALFLAAVVVPTWPADSLPAVPLRSPRPPAVDTTSTVACSLSESDFRTVTAVLERWSDRRRRLSDVPGLVLGVACGSERTWTRGFGLADRERRLPATDTTTFRIASISKVFTAMAVMQLRDAGRLSLDDPVAEHLDWFRPANAGEHPPVRVRHLLTHTSGLPTNSAATDFNAMTQPTAGALIAALPEERLRFEPGTDSKYSNLGFAVLGQLVAEVSGRPFEVYLRRELLEPLGLDRTVPHPTQEAVQAVGYRPRVSGTGREPAEFLHLASFTPAGGMATTGDDMLRFTRFLLGPTRSPEVLDPETVREMQRVQHPVGDRGGSGLAWAVERGPEMHVVYHGGGLPSQTSHLRLDLENELGVIVLTNAMDAGADAYAREALSLLRLAAESEASAEPRRQRRSPTDYTGRYRFREFELWVVRLGGRTWVIDPVGLFDPLAGRPSTTAMELVPTGEHRFRVVSGWAKGETASFAVDEGVERALRLRMPAMTLRRIGAVEKP